MGSPGIGRVIMSKDKKTFCDLDKIHFATAVIEEGHHQVHLGNVYGLSEFFVIPSSEIHVLIVSPTVETHVRIAISVSGNAQFRLCEDVGSLVGEAAAGALFNRNRQRELDAGSEVADESVNPTQTVTSFAGGIELVSTFLPGGTRNQATGSSSSSQDEWVFAGGLLYAFEITNLALTEMLGSINLDIYAPSNNLRK